MPVKKNDLLGIMKSKFGFKEAGGEKHDTISLYIDGMKVASTRFSRGHDEIDDGIQNMIARQIHAPTISYLKKMYGCTISSADYLGHLREKGFLTPQSRKRK